MTDEEMKRLEELAKKATPGPWFAGAWSGQCHVNHGGIHPGPPACRYDYLKTEAYGFVSAEQPGVSIVADTTNGTAMAARDKGFIAAANPAAVLALIERVRKAERKGAEEMRAAILRHLDERVTPSREFASTVVREVPLPGDAP